MKRPSRKKVQAEERWESVAETDSATVMGMGIEGRDLVRRAREPMVEEAERRREAERMRERVWRRRGREDGVVGTPIRLRSWWEKVDSTGRSVSLERWTGFSGLVGDRGWLRIMTPPHWGTSQLVAWFSATTRGDWEGDGT